MWKFNKGLGQECLSCREVLFCLLNASWVPEDTFRRWDATTHKVRPSPISTITSRNTAILTWPACSQDGVTARLHEYLHQIQCCPGSLPKILHAVYWSPGSADLWLPSPFSSDFTFNKIWRWSNEVSKCVRLISESVILQRPCLG